MISREDGANIKEILLRRYRLANLNASADRSNDEKANILFQVILDFMIEMKWKYIPNRDNTDNTKLHIRGGFTQQYVNCFDLTNLFFSMCKKLNISNVSKVEYYHSPLKKLGVSFSPLCKPLKCFDDTAEFTDNEVLFDNHCVIKVDNCYYDLVFSTIYNHLRETCDDSPLGKMVSYITAKNERRALEFLKDYMTAPTQTFQGMNILDWAIDQGLSVLSKAITIKYPELAHTPAIKPSSIPSIYLFESRSKVDATFMYLQYAIPAALPQLITKIDNINLQSPNGSTLLHLAANSHLIHLCQALIKHGANSNIRDHAGMYAIEYVNDIRSPVFQTLAKATDNSLVQLYLFNYIVSSMMNKNDRECIQDINAALACGFDINHVNCYGSNLLHEAVPNNRRQAVEFLLRKGCDANHVRNNGDRPIDLCQPLSDLIDILQRYTCDAISRSDMLHKVMTMVSQDDADEVKRLTSTFGLCIDVQDQTGSTMLHRAVEFESANVVKWLLSNDASLHIINHFNKKPLELCQGRYCGKIRDMLIAHERNPIPVSGSPTLTTRSHSQIWVNESRQISTHSPSLAARSVRK